VSLFEKILVPLDGSENSLRALEKAVQIAKKFNGKITLIHVYSVSYLAVTPTQVYRYVKAIRKNGTDILADGKKRVTAEGVQVETLLSEGHTVEEILKTAREGDFDLVVIGARGISRIREILVGSVSDGVTKHAPCPVLVVK
jgi:nucleotide-binding universal stress UspA family protein